MCLPFMFQKLVIIGIGLIGGSFGLAAKERRLAKRIVGVARRQSTLEAAVRTGACDEATSDLIAAATGADFVLLSPPVGQMKAMCEAIVPVVAPGALITDAGSTKADIVRECEPIFAERAHFLGGHPMAGSEKTGVEAARSDLFQNAMWLLTPTAQTDHSAIIAMENVVREIGAKPLQLGAQEHDQLVALTSHLPHVTASALVHSFLDGQNISPAIAQLVAGGWRDSTRVAAGSSEMWRDISLANRAALLQSVRSFQAELAQFANLLESEDSQALFDWFERAALERRKF
jgi:prephenate dehydrogenase